MANSSESVKSFLQKKGTKKKLYAAALLLLLVTALIIFISIRFVLVGEGFLKHRLVGVSSEDLNLFGKGYTNVTNIEKLSGLKKLDIRGCSISAERYEEIKAALPDCDIRWDVPLGEKSFDCMSTSVSVDDSANLDNLSYLPMLTEVDTADYSDYDAIEKARADYPNVVFNWVVNIEGAAISSDTTSLKLSANASAQDIAQLKRLPNLKTVDATECTLYDDLVSADNVISGCDIEWYVDLDGQQISSLDKKIDLRKHKFNNADAVSSAVKHLPNLEKVDMCGCGLSDEQMQSLRDAFPKTKFVWYISFGRWTNVRTDIQIFSALNYSTQTYNEKTYAPLLKYCTDLVGLDLGHSSINDVSDIANLKKLRCLLLLDNRISDISPFAELENLELLEITSNNVKDFSPLNGLKNLKYINIGFNNPIAAYNTAYDFYDPTYVWVCARGTYVVSNVIKNKFLEAYPNAKVCFFVAYSDGCGPEWRQTDFYRGYRLCFRNWWNVEYFNSWDDYKFVDGAKIITPNKF